MLQGVFLSKRFWIVLFFVAMIAFFFLDLVIGSVFIPIGDVLSIAAGSPTVNPVWETIVQRIRIPQAITAVFAGSALAVSGLQTQTLFRNPLADTSLLGITAGASLGVATVMLVSGSGFGQFMAGELGFLTNWVVVLAAISGSVVVLIIVLAVSVRIKDHVGLLIVGLMVGHITAAVVSIWQHFSQPEQIQDYMIWGFGSLGSVRESQLLIMGLVVFVGIFFSFFISKPLNSLLLGENYARSMGLSIQKTRILIIGTTCLLAGVVTAFCGPIGFLGVAVPHLMRSLLNTSDHRILIPSTCLGGAVVMLACDILAKMPASQAILPINAVTALLGAPVVIMVILRRRSTRSIF